ncbi:M14 family zinc carboxypeptidase [Termitidicoccus mucosus]|uniref:Peptidase M14 domain-containing protein n=1 Tax=Termitidicoccus mucosus TaxID=1184151 RepID=A0A178IN62_9BACT|nr:hypothetical protein AW736_07635 [Opitutaceae bacterium TSB47]
MLAGFVFALPIFAGKPVPGNPDFPDIPNDLLQNADEIPAFWVSEVDAIASFLKEKVKRGRVMEIGRTAGGRPILAVAYGEPRKGRGTTTFSGAIGFFDVRAYLGPDHAKKVFVGLGGVHGGEFEGIVGVVNFISVLETGRDLRGREWPELTAAAARIDRIVLVPVVNIDGRVRIPLRMEPFAGTDNRYHQYFNTGTWKNGRPIGWPTIKEFIPLEFSRTQFPGGYPNDAGVNLMHDDFLGARQPETQALLDLMSREKPDLLFNMHTGAPPENYYMRMHRPAAELRLDAVYEELYRTVHTALALAGLQGTKDPAIEAAKPKRGNALVNLDAALNMHCGVLSVVIESPSHSFAGRNRQGEVVPHSADMLLDAQLVAYQSGLGFLADNGGRAKWAPK